MSQLTLPVEPVRVHRLGGGRRWAAVYADLFFIRWANVRNEWYFHVILGPLFPLAILAFMRMTGAVRDPAGALYVTAGNAIAALVLGPMQSLNNDLAWGRQRNDLEYYSTLPFSKLQLILAFVSVSTVFTIPGMLLTIFIGSAWLGFPVVANPLVLPIMLVSALSMAGLGAVMGVHARNGHHANMMNGIASLVVTFMSPLLIPYENLPLVLRFTSKLLPTSYAADAFRAALAGRSDPAVLANLGVVVLFAVAFLVLATKRLDWRVD
ncbi:MAG: ABC transporter permease [Bacillota bacterium]